MSTASGMGPAPAGLPCVDGGKVGCNGLCTQNGRRQFAACALDAGLLELLGSINQGILARFTDLDRKLELLLQLQQKGGAAHPPEKDAGDRAFFKRAPGVPQTSPHVSQAWLSDDSNMTPQHSGRSRGQQFVVHEESATIAPVSDFLSVFPRGEEALRTPNYRSSRSQDEDADTLGSTRELPPPDQNLEVPNGEAPTLHQTESEWDQFYGKDSPLELKPIHRRRSSSASQLSELICLIRTSNFGVGQKIWKFLEDPESSRAALWFYRIWDPFILCTIFVTALQTVTPQPISGTSAVVVEMSFDIIFTLEVLLRFAGSPSTYLFVKNFHNVTDIIAAVPPLIIRAYLGFNPPARDVGRNTDPHNLLLSLVPMVRVMKTLRRFDQFHLFLIFFESIVEALRVLLFTLLILVLSVSALIYLVEPRSNIESLPQAMWLTIVTVTTVGYGDITPVTTVGHLVVALLILSSVLYMAMPIGIIGNAFTQIWQDRDRIMLVMKTRDRLIQWGYTAGDMVKLFQHFNTDGDDNMSIVEFKIMMHEMQIGMSDERVVELFNSIDKDASGGIDDKEFIQGLFPSAYYQIYGEKKQVVKEESESARNSRGSDARLNDHGESHHVRLSRNQSRDQRGPDMLAPLRRGLRTGSNISKGSRADMIISRTNSYQRGSSKQSVPPKQWAPSAGADRAHQSSSASSSYPFETEEPAQVSIPERGRAPEQGDRAADLDRMLRASQAEHMPGQPSIYIPEHTIDVPSLVTEEVAL